MTAILILSDIFPNHDAEAVVLLLCPIFLGINCYRDNKSTVKSDLDIVCNVFFVPDSFPTVS